MDQSPEDETSLPENDDQIDIAELFYQLNQRLSVIEKKIDTLISKPSAPKDSFRSFDNSKRRDNNRDNDFHKEKSFTRVICSKCSKECEIPFKPTDNRPVFCKECFSKNDRKDSFGAKRENRSKERSFSRRDSSESFKFGKKSKTSGKSFDKKKKSTSVRRKKRI